jgi:hypothetical protein
MLAWYPSYEFRFTIGYGYGVLDRFATRGAAVLPVPNPDDAVSGLDERSAEGLRAGAEARA